MTTKAKALERQFSDGEPVKRITGECREGRKKGKTTEEKIPWHQQPSTWAGLP
jgi:hypothetical protein